MPFQKVIIVDKQLSKYNQTWQKSIITKTHRSFAADHNKLEIFLSLQMGLFIRNPLLYHTTFLDQTSS
jgi:hypothetical protein